MGKKRSFRITVKNYGDDEVNKMAVICKIYDDFTAPEMQRVHRFISSKYEDMLTQVLELPA